MPRRFSRRRRMVRAKRPIDKQIIGVNINDCDSSTNPLELYGATFPCTISGFRAWVSARNLRISAAAAFPTATSVPFATCFHWAVVISRQGMTVQDMTFANGTMYSPEQDVIMFGQATIMFTWYTDTGTGTATRNNGGGPCVADFFVESKTKRKLMGGDRIMLITAFNGGSNPTIDTSANVQFFAIT